MATLDDLLTLDGVALAFDYTPDGKLGAYKATMDVSPEMGARAAQFCTTVTILFHTLAGSFTELSRMPWVPQHGWA